MYTKITLLFRIQTTPVVHCDWNNAAISQDYVILCLMDRSGSKLGFCLKGLLTLCWFRLLYSTSGAHVSKSHAQLHTAATPKIKNSDPACKMYLVLTIISGTKHLKSGLLTGLCHAIFGFSLDIFCSMCQSSMLICKNSYTLGQESAHFLILCSSDQQSKFFKTTM